MAGGFRSRNMDIDVWYRSKIIIGGEIMAGEKQNYTDGLSEEIVVLRQSGKLEAETASEDKKKLVIFMAITFLLPVLMGILMGIQYKRGFDVSVFVLLQTYYPSLGVIIATWVVNKNGEYPKRFYGGFVALTAILFIYSSFTIFFPSKEANSVPDIIISAGSLLLLILFFADGKNIREACGLGFKNGEKGIHLIALFFLLYMARAIIGSTIDGSLRELFSNFGMMSVMIFILLPFSFLFSYTAFLGEEYGWRYFLQPLLFKYLGSKKGILLLGVLWGIWHLPINMFYYSPDTWLQSVCVQLSTCISLGIFFGYSYLKTNNIWILVIMHYINNNMVLVFMGTDDVSNQILSWSDVSVSVIINLILFVPFIFTKEFSEGKQK